VLALCNGMPRAGSTLQYNIARCLVEKGGLGQAEAFITADKDHAKRIEKARLTGWATDDPWHVAKTHEVFDALPELLDGGRTRVLYVYRDLRDVAVSIKRAFAATGDELMRRVVEGVEWYERLDALRSSHPTCFLWVRYEDMYADLPSAIQATADFLHLNASDAVLGAVHAECRIETAENMTRAAKRELARVITGLRKQSPERANAFAAQVRHAGWAVQESLLHHHHISSRHGEPGGWRELLPEDEAGLIAERFREWLVAGGYAVDTC